MSLIPSRRYPETNEDSSASGFLRRLSREKLREWKSRTDKEQEDVLPAEFPESSFSRFHGELWSISCLHSEVGGRGPNESQQNLVIKCHKQARLAGERV